MTLAEEDVVRVASGIPLDLRDIMRDSGAYLAGGAVRALVAGEAVSDFDLFSASKEAAERLSALICTRRLGDGLKPSRMATDNAITILSPGRTPVQCILKFYSPDPAAMIATFDFTVVQAAAWLVGGAWCSACSAGFYPDLAARRMTYTAPAGDGEACGSLLRLRRYLARGYSIQAGSLAGIVARLVRTTPELAIAMPEQTIANALLRRMQEVDPLYVVDGIFGVPTIEEQSGPKL